MLRKFNPSGMPTSPAYSHGVEITSPSRMLFVSGQVGMLADGSVAEGVGDQVRAAIANLDTVLAESGMSRADVAKYTIFLAEGVSIDDYRAAMGPLLPAPPPASSLFFVKALASPAFLVEIEAIAVR
ncbi:RidA family protein [Devosia lacusdianchii]|jgi:2-iminobutanoate/2-iminopropanoate deaminase|uniref:RidA family protein n=1 Tax=Devosia lacusdianchii TaxID=2917991 RepID=UPI001F05CFE5|nr:RidA family protein [Devosia sp. JXJ CY 41]